MANIRVFNRESLHILEKANAILIRKTLLTESSLIVSWLTEESGFVRTAAKGARRPRSPFSGKLDLFYQCEISFARSRKGDLHALRETHVSNYRRGLQANYGRVLCASYFARLLELVCEPEAPAPELHDLLRRALDFLDTNDASELAVRHFEKETAKALGIFPGGKTPGISVLRQVLHREPEQRDPLMRHLRQQIGDDSSDKNR